MHYDASRVCALTTGGKSMGLLDGKTALVAGGGTGIGRAIAQRLHEEGAFVVVSGRRKEKLAEAAAAISPQGKRFEGIPADLTRDEDIARLMAEVMTRHAGLDVLVNCMGIMRFGRLETLKRQELRDMIEVNTVAPWMLSMAALPLMRSRGTGSIVNIASISGMRPFAGSGAYCGSKSALIMMSQVMALEHAAEGIRVNCICPGMVEETELGDAVFSAAQVQASYERFRSTHPLGRNGKPRDVADAALFFASTQSAWITGAVLPLDGGRLLTTNSPA
jgi:NAD(P)-dependent dehydrogenase (short-subunit alcohol dehydrogenase family)